MNVEPTSSSNEVLDDLQGCRASGDQQDDQGVPSSVPEPGATGPLSAADLPPTDTDTCSHQQQHHHQQQQDDDCGLPSSAQHQDAKVTAELCPSSETSLETERLTELLVEAEMVVGGAEHLPDTDDTNEEIEMRAVNENENTSNDDTSTDGHHRSFDNRNSNKIETDPQEEEATATLHVPTPPQSPTTLSAVGADEAQTDAVIEEKDEKQDDVPTTLVAIAAAACYPSVADILLKGHDDDEEEEREVEAPTAETVGGTVTMEEVIEVSLSVPETPTSHVDTETQEDSESVCYKQNHPCTDDDESEGETMHRNENMGVSFVCDESAETLPMMMDGDDTGDHGASAGINESSSSMMTMGLPFLSPGTKMVQRAVIESMAIARDPARAEEEEEKEEEEGEEKDVDVLAISDNTMTDILSPETRMVHQRLVEGCTTDINSAAPSNAGNVGDNSMHAEIKDEQIERGDAAVTNDHDTTFDPDNCQSDKMIMIATPDRRNASLNSVHTDDGMSDELTNLNMIENEIRREVESPHVEIKAAAASPRRIRNGTTAFIDGDTPSRRSSIGASSNGGSGISASSTFGGAEATNINNALEQLQQQVGAMAREALLSQDSDNEIDSTFVPLGADPKQMSFMSDADDGLDEELKNLSDAENEVRREMEGAQMMEGGIAKELEQKATMGKEVVGSASLHINESNDDSDGADETVFSSPTTTALLDEKEHEEERPAITSLMASPVSLSLDASQPTPTPKLSFQECIELQRWDFVRNMLDADHGKVARQDVFIMSDSASDLGDGEDEADCVDDCTDGADTRHRRRATALHLACTRDPPLDVVKSLIDANPEAISSPTRLGWEYPLHYAIGSGMASDNVINALTEAYPDAVSKVSSGAARFGVHKSPLHLAVAAFLQDDDDASPSISVLRTMCRRNPAARKVRDGSGRMPLELAKAIQFPTSCPQDLKKILLPSNDINEMIVFRVKSFLLAILVVGAAWILKKLERFGASLVDRAEESFAEVVSMGSSGLAVAFCICIIALLVVNTTRIIQQDKAQHRMGGEDEDESASDELVTILYVSAVGLIVLFATEPVTLLLHTTVVTGCALGYILLRRSKKGPIDENTNSEFLDCREIHGSMSDSSLKDSAARANRSYDMTPLERDGMCIVCWERPADHVLVPCGHLCLCAECPRHLGDDLNWQCPIGKCSVHAAMKVFPAQIKRSDGDDDFDTDADDKQDCERVGSVPTHDDDSTNI